MIHDKWIMEIFHAGPEECPCLLECIDASAYKYLG
jgi:hypothetical protein